MSNGMYQIVFWCTIHQTLPEILNVKLNCFSNFIEIPLLHGCSPVNLVHIFRTPFPTSEGLLLSCYSECSWKTCTVKFVFNKAVHVRPTTSNYTVNEDF